MIGRAKALGIYEDENIPALLFPDVAETVSKLTPQNHALNTIEKTDFKIDRGLPATIKNPFVP